MNNKKLVIPDPDIYKRSFIAVQLLELNPNIILADTGKNIKEIAGKFNIDDMCPMANYTKILRKMILKK